MEYVVIERLAQGGRDKLKDDGLNLSDWLQSLASFWGHLYVFFSYCFCLFKYVCFEILYSLTLLSRLNVLAYFLGFVQFDYS